VKLKESAVMLRSFTRAVQRVADKAQSLSVEPLNLNGEIKSLNVDPPNVSVDSPTLKVEAKRVNCQYCNIIILSWLQWK
jgi:hypothetical protein